VAKSESKRSFHYEHRSKEDVKARANMRGGGYDSFVKPEFKRYKVRDGKNLVRILPATWEKPKHYGYDIWVNYGIGADNQSYLSLSKMNDEADPLAEARKQAQREGDDETAKALSPRQRVLVWVIDRNEEDEGPQLWDIPFSVDKDFINLCLDEDTKEVIYPDDPDNGHDLRFYKEGSGLGTKYPASRMKLLDESPLHEDQGTQDEWLEFVKENPVPDCLQFYSADQIASAFDGQVRTKDDNDEKPRKKLRDEDDEGTKPKRRPVADEDDDSEEKPKRRATKDDDEDEPDEKPRRARTQLKDEDEPDEADEKPRKKAKPARDEDEEQDEKPRQSIRERLAARRSKSTDEDDD
jgi:hypothetical protein